MENFVFFIIDRLKERSTWLGIITVVTSMGVALSPELAEGIITAGLAISGLIAIITKDKR